MTQLLEKMLNEVYKLPPEKQDAIALIILEELEDEQRWDKTFAESQEVLAQLAQEARDDIKAGRVKKMGSYLTENFIARQNTREIHSSTLPAVNLSDLVSCFHPSLYHVQKLYTLDC